MRRKVYCFWRWGWHGGGGKTRCWGTVGRCGGGGKACGCLGWGGGFGEDGGGGRDSVADVCERLAESGWRGHGGLVDVGCGAGGGGRRSRVTGSVLYHMIRRLMMN